MKLSDYVFEFVAGLGVRHVFMLPGGGAMHLVDSLGAQPRLDFVCNLHEQASAIAAEAYGRATQNLGVALVTTGPGGTNALTGVAGAWLASTPCLFISGQVKRQDLKGDLGVRQRGPQELDIVTLVGSITKYAAIVMDPSRIRYHLERAVHEARSGRRGPVWIDIPLDVQAADIDPEALEGFEAPAPGQDGGRQLEAQVEELLQALNRSRRPVVLLGNGAQGCDRADLMALLESLGVPVLATWAGCDLIPGDHPLCFGKPGTIASRGANFTLQNADLLLSLGARLDPDVAGFNAGHFARQAFKAVVDIDPAELGKHGTGVHLPICADVADVVRLLGAKAARPGSPDRQPWLDRCRAWKAAFPLVAPGAPEAGRPISVFDFAAALCEASQPEDLILPGSSGSGIDMFWMTFKAKPGQRAFSTGGLGAMGFGVPAAIGGCLALGGKRTLCVDGDGGFFMNIQELETAARLQLPVKYFVLNNNGYASIRNMQRNHFKGHMVASGPGSRLTLPDIGRVAQAFGLKAFCLEDPSRMASQIAEALAHPGPVVCDVRVDPDQVTSPKVSSAVRPDGSIVSRPLEDLWPFLERDVFKAQMIVPPLED